MADRYEVITASIATPTPPTTIGLITAGATKRLRVVSILIGSDNATALAGARLSVGRPTTAGTGGTAATPVALDSSAPAAIFTALTGSTVWSAEPTQPTNYDAHIALNAVASYLWVPDPSFRQEFIVPVNGRVALRVESDASTTKVRWVATWTIEEG